MLRRFELLNSLSKVLIHRTKVDCIGESIIMIACTNEEEKSLDEGYPIVVGHTTLTPKEVIAYGDINFENEEDVKVLSKLDIYKDNWRGGFIPNNYDYEKHCGYTELKTMNQFIETFDSIKILKYAHGQLNKPSKIILFKVINSKVKLLW